MPSISISGRKTLKASPYLKNLAKSAGYISMDVFKAYAPTMSALASTTKEATTSGYQAIKDFTSSSNDSDFSFKGIKNKSGQVINNLWKNTVEDLKSGKIYNKERSDALGDEIASGFLGDDFNFDFDFDDDWGDDDESSSSEASTKAVVAGEMESAKAIVSAVDAMGRGISASMTNATVESATYIASSARENSLALFNLNKEGFGTITKALMSVNETIYGFSKIGEPLSAHMQNSSLFYAKTGESLNNIEQTLKQIEQNTKPAPTAGSKGYKSKRSLGSMMSDEGINWSELADSMKETVEEYKDLTSMFVDMLRPTAKSGGKNISLLGMGSVALTKKLIPKVFGDALKELDESLKYGLGSGLTRISKKRTGNILVDTLLDMFMPGRDLKSKISSANYEKGPVQWDGVARKALTDVIPTTLLQIYSVLSGTEPMRFDYDRGTFVKASSISAAFNDRKSKYVKESGGAFYEEVEKAIKGSNKNSKEQAKMLADAYKFFEYAFENTDHNITNKSGIDPATFAMIQAVAANMKDRKFKNKWVVEANKKAAEWSNSNRAEETSGFSMMQTLHNELTGEGNNAKRGTKTTIIGLDQYGHNYYYYLQGIWKYTGYMVNNWGSVAIGEVNEDAPKLTSKDLPKINYVKNKKKKGEKTTSESNDSLGLFDKTEEEEEADKKKETTNKLKKWYEDNINGKLRNKVGKILGKELTPEQFSAVGVMNSVSNAINDLIWGGDEKNPEKGLFSYLFEKSKKMFDKFSDYFKKNFVDKLKDWFNKNVTHWKDSSWVKDTRATLGRVGNHLKGSTRKIFIGDSGYDNGTAAYGRKVSKTGIVTVSEGELIIPSELNPYYHGATNKASQINNEMRISGGRYPMYAKGNYDGEYGFVMRDATADEDFSARHGIGQNSIFGLLIRGAFGAFSKVKSVLDKSVDEKKIEEDKKKISSKISKMLNEVGGSKGEIGAGAVIGAGASILTGGIIGPIAGAALGAGIGFLTKSKAAQDFIFGEINPETGKRDKQKLFDFFNKELPSIGTGAALGGAAGLFLGSPILGAFIGGTIGFAKSSESFKNVLFGEFEEEVDEKGNKVKVRKGGVISKKLQEKIKSAAPGIALGAAGGIIAGPFGLVGNVLLGSTLGYATATGKFNKLLFGDSEDGSDKNSLFFQIKENIFGSLNNLFHNITNRFTQWLGQVGKDLGEKLRDFGKSLKERSKDPNAGFFTKLFGGMYNFGEKVVRLPFNVVGGFTKRLSDRVEATNLLRGYSTYNRAENRNMTAEERITAMANMKPSLLKKYAKKNPIAKDMIKFDEFLANINDYKKLEKYKALIHKIKTYPSDSEEYIKAVDELTNDPEYKKYMKDSSTDFLKKNIAKLSGLIEDETKRKNFSPEEVQIGQLDKIKTLVDNIYKTMNGESIYKSESGVKEETTVTADGIIKTVTDKDGNTEFKKGDKGTSLALAKSKSLSTSIKTIPAKITSGIGKLFGIGEDNEDNKNSFLSKVKDFLGEKFSKIKKFASKFIAPVVGIAAGIAGLVVLAKSLFGKKGSFSNRILNKIGEGFGFGTADEETNDIKTQYVDADGNTVTKNENGQYVNDNGEIVSSSNVSVQRAGKDTFLSKFRKTNLRQVILKKPTLAGTMAKKMVTKNKIYKLATENSGKIAEKITKFFDLLTSNLKKILSRLPIDDVTREALQTKLPGCFKTLAEKISSSNVIKSAKGVLKNLEDMVPVLNVVAAVSDFITGYEDARTTLGITEEPSKAQRILAGLLRLIKNLIPIVGPFIPDDLIINVLCKGLSGIFGDLVEQRERAKNEVAQYNAENNTNYTVAEYNKSVLNDYTFTERIGNVIKTGWNQGKDKLNAAKAAYAEGGGVKGFMAKLVGADEIKAAYNDAGGGAKGAWAGIVEIFNQIPGVGETASKTLKLAQYAFTGDAKFWDSNSSMLDAFKDSTAANGAKSSIFSKIIGSLPLSIIKTVLTPVAAITSSVTKVFSSVKNFFGGENMSQNYNALKQYRESLDKYLEDKKYDKVISTSFEVKSSDSGVMKGIFNFAGGFIHIVSIIKAGIKKAVGWIGDIVNYGKGLLGISADEKEGENRSTANSSNSNGENQSFWGSLWSKTKSLAARIFGSGSGLAVNGGASCINCGFQSQLDPRYKNVSFGNSTIGDVGCAPAVGKMISASMGGSMDMDTAISKARPYTNADGTSARYFEDTFNASPLKNTSTVKTALENGRPVVLLGRDASNKDKSKSPFGPNNHYVLATAMKNGKVLVNDPEANGPRIYDQSILNKTSYNLTYGGRSRRRGKGGFSDTTDAQQIWAYLTGTLGFSEAGAAGLMGCWAEESSNNPNTIEGFYLSNYPGDEAVRTTKGLNDYTTNVLFPAYAGQGINYEAYKGTDGNYYPGFGLAQWTGTRGQALHEYSKTSGSDWYTLDNQLKYLGYEMSNSYADTAAKLRSATDVATATQDAMRGYEGNTSSSYYNKRLPFAQQIFNTYKGKKFTYNGSAASSSSTTDNNSTESSSSDGGLLSLISKIFGSLGNIFNINGFSMDDTSTSGSSTNSSTGGVTNAKGAAAAAQAAENELGYAETGDNITKFGKWSGCDGLPWCGAFAAWAISQAFDGQKSSAEKALYGCENVNYCPTLVNTFKRNNAWFDEPEVGDQVLYSQAGDDAEHVGLVTSVDKNAKTFVSVEGNTNNQVTKKQHSSYKDGNVYGFGRPNYAGANATVVSNGNTGGNIISGDADYSATGSGLRGGSSGLLRKAAPSRFTYGSLKGQKFRFGGSSGILNNKNRFSGAGTNITKTVTKTLTNLKKNLTGGLSNNGYSGGGSIDAELVENLLVSITQLLNSINNNTAPTQQIYDALKEYIDYVKGNKSNTSTDQVSMPTTSNEVDTNFANLVTTLAAIARG